ncbi:MAG: murein hydrolase activator EnvC family protein [Aestuariibacter sp.]
MNQSLSKLPTALLTLMVVLTIWGAACAQSYAQAQTEQELIELQTQIQSKKATLQQKLKAAEALQQQLKTAELQIATLTKATIINRQELKLVEDEKRTLNNRRSKLLTQKQQQENLLASQIRSAYMAGNHDYTKMLLNQENAGKFERLLVYYRYLNQARQEQIDSFTSLITELKDIEAALGEQETKLLALQQQQETQRQQLQLQQQSRETTLQTLQSTINSDAEQIEQLQINEQQLAQAISDAIAAVEHKSNITFSGLAAVKGRLPKPVDGRYQRLFGKRRQGQVRWKGVIFNSTNGRPVSAIHQGKVLYADWVKGLGLVTVIDHGDGFMSLYGHNQALLRNAGDIVDAGETIALVGQSGGRSSAGLYFELRHKGRAINPSNWLDL